MEYSIPAEIMGEAEMNGLGMDEESIDKVINTVSHSIQPDSGKQLPDPIDFLKEVMKENGLRNKDMKIYIGSSGNVCSVLKRHKPLTLRMIRNLHKYLHIPAEILIQPYDCH